MLAAPLTGIDSTRFRATVEPPCRLYFVGRAARSRVGGGKVIFSYEFQGLVPVVQTVTVRVNDSTNFTVNVPPGAPAVDVPVTLAVGDTLNAIAKANLPAGVTLNQMLIAIYRANQDAFIRENRFSFARAVATRPEEQTNPWLLLNRRFEDGAIPVIGDATSLAYVFHLAVGDDYVMQGPDNRPLRLRIVGSLRDSVLQSELIMGDAAFTRSRRSTASFCRTS